MSYDKHTQKKPLALVVDDDVSLRLTMGAALAKANFDVIEAENGHLALSLFKSQKPNLILLDVVMPEMDGFEVCMAIRNLPGGKYPQVLMVTGMDDIESTARAFEAGANDFIAKPINWVMLGYRAKYMLRAGQAFRELYINKSRLTKTQALAKLGNWEIDLVSNEFFCSSEACSLLGLDPMDTPLTYTDFLSPIIANEQAMVKQTIDNAVKTKNNFSLNYQVMHSNGTQKHILNQGEVFFNSSGVPEIMLGVVQDLSQLKQAEERIRFLAFYDGLTGLANRMLFLDRLDMEIQKATRHGQKFALLFLDLDQFKKINDTLGHHIGDLLLKNVAETLKKCIRSTDTATRRDKDESGSMIARLGGDEFTIMLSNINNPEDSAVIAERILNRIPKTYKFEGNDVSVTASIGISVFPTDGTTSESLLKNADSAMYHAKNRGRNNYQFYMESLNRAAVERFSMERDLKKALEREEFVLYYQPQINLADRKIVGAEALIRWIHPTKGMIMPDKFIPIAEETDLIIDINKWVLQAASKQNQEWTKAGLNSIRVAVNLSGYKLASQDIIQSIKEALETVGLDAKKLELEITENILMQDNEETLLIFRQIKDLNIRIALDDFGTGYSSLSYLTSFPVDTIKIDRSFVMGSTEQNENRVIIKAIIAMGHSLGKKIVAEGIETKEQFDLLKRYGCDEAQGYYFKPPVPENEFAKLLARGVL
ncbi:MAG: EAL domain-containing protein [Desulfobacterium sp.]|nr:EAL domain-containing protein [Desulfobacterium sp.]